jgi:hypothetical protein
MRLHGTAMHDNRPVLLTQKYTTLGSGNRRPCLDSFRNDFAPRPATIRTGRVTAGYSQDVCYPSFAVQFRLTIRLYPDGMVEIVIEPI